MIICLETRAEEAASHILTLYIEEAIVTHDRNLIRRIRRLWRKNAFGVGPKHGERWRSILKKFNTEGSTWYVWWMDGVRNYMRARWS